MIHCIIIASIYQYLIRKKLEIFIFVNQHICHVLVKCRVKVALLLKLHFIIHSLLVVCVSRKFESCFPEKSQKYSLKIKKLLKTQKTHYIVSKKHKILNILCFFLL